MRPLLLLLLLLLFGSAVALRFAAPDVVFPAPVLELQPAQLDLGRVPIGGLAEGVFVATNVGTRRVVARTSGTSDSFELRSAEVALDPGESRALSVVFHPTQRGPAVATLRFEADGHEVPLELNGFGFAPAALEISPLSLSFGEVELGAVVRGLLTIRNGGDETLSLEGMSSGSPFRVETAMEGVPAGEEHTVAVAFRPDQSRIYEGTLSIRSNDPAQGLVAIHLRGAGRPVAPRVAIATSATGLDFGEVPPCEAGERVLAISNRGTDPLTIASVTAPPPFAAPARGHRVPAGRSLRLPLTFSPQGEGPALATLQIHSNDPRAGVVSVDLMGKGRGSGSCDRSVGARSSARTHDGMGRAHGGAASRAELRAEPDPPAAEPAFEDEEQESPAPPGRVPALRDGSLVHLGTYGGTIAPDQLRSVTLDPGTGVLTIEGLQLPLVELPFDERFEFATTGGTARVSEIGDVDMVLPVEMRDADGNATRLEMKLTTGTASTRVTHGVFFTRAGEPLGPEGDATLVGLATIPSGGLKGFAMEIVLNVHVDL